MKKSLLAIIALILAIASPTYAAEDPVDVLAAHGIAASKAGDNKTAIGDFTKAIAIDPEFAPTYAMRGYTYILMGNGKAAIEDYGKAIELNPQYAVAFNGRGEAREQMGEYEAALEDFSKAVEINPELDYAKTNKARVEKLLATPPGERNKRLLRDLLSEKSRFENAMKTDCRGFSPTALFGDVVGNMMTGAKHAQEMYSAQNPNSRVNILNCSGEYVAGAKTYTYGAGGKLLGITEVGDGLELTLSYPAGGVNISVVSQTQSSVMAQIACANDNCNIVDVSLPGMDARGSMLMIVNGKGVSVGSNALIAFLRGYYERKHSRSDNMLTFCNALVTNGEFRRGVMEAFVP